MSESKYISNKKVLVTGGAGFLGSRVVEQLTEYNPTEIVVTRSIKADLRDNNVCAKVVQGMDLVIHLAANVGGIGYNQKHPGALFYDNLIIGAQMMEQARLAGVSKFVSVGTVCEYPKYTPVPFKEEDIWNGYPEETNAPYGLAKKMQLVQAQAYRQEYGFNAIHLVPVNLYGPGDNFDPKSAHVIPDLIRKFVDAKENNLPNVSVWGTGSATREFLYVDDAAKAVVLAAAEFDKSDPVNIGSSYEISIKDLAELIKTTVGFEGEIVWDKTKPDGQPKRKLDVEKAKQEFGFESKVDFKTGLKSTVDWYLKNCKELLQKYRDIND